MCVVVVVEGPWGLGIKKSKSVLCHELAAALEKSPSFSGLQDSFIGVDMLSFSVCKIMIP